MIGFYERYFYFVHIEPDARPISMVTVLVNSGVGILGSVWTSPGYRRKGCLKEIMKCVQSDFKTRKWKALYLGTGYNSLAFQIYLKFGWQAVEQQSGYMEYYGEEGIHDVQRANELKIKFEKQFFGKLRNNARQGRKCCDRVARVEALSGCSTAILVGAREGCYPCCAIEFDWMHIARATFHSANPR